MLSIGADQVGQLVGPFLGYMYALPVAERESLSRYRLSILSTRESTGLGGGECSLGTTLFFSLFSLLEKYLSMLSWEEEWFRGLVCSKEEFLRDELLSLNSLKESLRLFFLLCIDNRLLYDREEEDKIDYR